MEIKTMHNAQRSNLVIQSGKTIANLGYLKNDLYQAINELTDQELKDLDCLITKINTAYRKRTGRLYG